MSRERVKLRTPKGGRPLVLAGLVLALVVGVAQAAWGTSAIAVDPTSGPAGAAVTVTGSGFSNYCHVDISFKDPAGTITLLGTAMPDSSGSFQVPEVVPSNSSTGASEVRGFQWTRVWGSHGWTCKPISFQPIRTTPFTVMSGGGELLGNTGFENGSVSPSPWVTTARINSASVEPPHSGAWDAWLGGTGTTHLDSLYQQVGIPAATSSATLSFYVHVDTGDASPTSHDQVRVQLRTASDTVLATLAVYSNLDAADGYTQRTFDLSGYAGQTIRIVLLGKEDASLQTSFVVDDFALTTA